MNKEYVGMLQGIVAGAQKYTDSAQRIFLWALSYVGVYYMLEIGWSFDETQVWNSVIYHCPS